MSALLQLRLQSQLNTRLQGIDQRQLQHETRNIYVRGWGATYIRYLAVLILINRPASFPMRNSCTGDLQITINSREFECVLRSFESLQHVNEHPQVYSALQKQEMTKNSKCCSAFFETYRHVNEHSYIYIYK